MIDEEPMEPATPLLIDLADRCEGLATAADSTVALMERINRDTKSGDRDKVANRALAAKYAEGRAAAYREVAAQLREVIEELDPGFTG